MNSEEREERLQEIIAGYLEAEESGEPPERGEFLARYPEWQAELELFLSNREKLADAFGKLGGLETPSLPATLSWASARHETGNPALPDLAAFGELEKIDQGGIGVVYRGKDPQLPRDLAIKVLRPDRQQPYLVRRFIEEAKITGKLQHPGVVPVHSMGQMPDGRPYFTMKLIRGQTLAALLAGRASPSQDLPRFLKIFEQVCQTLAYAHSQEIVHRDLKPANIMVGHFAEVQVMDWGFAKVLRTPDDQQPATAEMHGVNVDYAKTQPGQVMGTLSYMPPEQARGEVNRVDERSDVFSLGAILCAILTDKPPYLGTTAEQLLAMAQGGDLAEARKRLDLALQSGAETELIALAWRCLSPNREDRPGNAGEVAEAVAEYQAGVQERLRAAELARTAAQAKAGEERKRRRLSVVLAAAVVLIVLGSSGAALWYIDDQARQEREALLQQVESARKKDAAAQDVRQNLTQAQKIHDKLIEELKKRGGVQNLLKSRWDLRIQSARDAWKLAKDRADNAEGSLDPELVELLKKLDGDLARDQRDYDLAWRLEKIHLDTATIVEGKFNYALAEREYPLAFAEAGLALEPGRLKETARLIQQSVIKEQLLAALDHWIFLNPKDRARSSRLLSSQLGEAISLADLDPWTNQVRKLAVSNDRAAIEKLANALERDEGLLGRLSPSILFFLSANLAVAKQESLLRLGQSHHPADFWCNFVLANFLAEKKRAVEAIGYHYVALAIRPKTSAVYINLGAALHDQKNLPAAIDAFKKALAIDDKDAYAWNNLGNALRDQKNLPDAIDAYKKALAIDDKFATAWYNLGNVLRDQKNLPAAIDAYKKALAIDDKYTKAWYNLGIALYHQKNLPAAIDACNKAINLLPDYAEAHCNLGHALREHGEFAAGLKALQKGHELGMRQPGWPYRSAAWVKYCQQLVTLEQKLPAVLKGGPADAGDLLALADLCRRYKKRYRDSAALFAKAFSKEPNTAENLYKAYRYNAACAAALAAAGKGVGADQLDAKQKAGLRQEALQWLQADLTARAGLLEQNPLVAFRIVDDLQHWQKDPDLAVVRDHKELDKLAGKECAAWQKFWTQVAALSKQARLAFNQTEHQGKLSDKEREQSYPVKMTAGKTYIIDMSSAQFDTYLRLEDDKGKVLAENDDISDENLNSRIIFSCNEDGSYRIVATSFQQAGRGAYVLTIREFPAKKQ